MGIFDLFTNDVAQQAAGDQIAGINSGLQSATGNINQGIGAINTSYGAALQPFTQNYNNAQGGVTALGNVLGLNGAQGSQSAMTALQNTPGYQFQQQQGNNAINAYEAASGKTASGNQMVDLANYNQGLASTTYNNYVSQLQPYLGASNSAASGIANVNTGQGTAVAGQYGSLANLNWQAATGIGNANANATLAQNNANQNQFNALTGIASAGLMAFSDERLKENAQPVGQMYDGTPIYSFNYKGQPQTQIGVMAQDVEKTHPDVVGESQGFKTVDYGKLAQNMAQFTGDGGGEQIRVNQPTGELTAGPAPSPTQRMGNTFQDLMERFGAKPDVARHLREGMGGILGMTPLGIAGSAVDAVDAEAHGNRTGTLQAMAGMIPGAGGEVRAVAEEIAPAVEREVAKRLRNQFTGKFRKAGETPLPGNPYRAVNTQAKPVAANSADVVSRTQAPTPADPTLVQSNLSRMDNPMMQQMQRPQADEPSASPYGIDRWKAFLDAVAQ